MNIKKTKKIMLRRKSEELLKYQVTAQYLTERIEEYGEKYRRENLTDLQKLIHELEIQIEFFKKR